MLNSKIFIFLFFLLLSVNGFCQFKKGIYLQSSISRPFNINIYSESGFILPIVAKNRTFLDFGIGYKVEKENGAINQYEFLTYTTGHRIGLDKNLFKGTNLFSFKSYFLSIGVGYKRLWPVLKQYFEKNKFRNKLYLGPVINITSNIANSFPYGEDSVKSTSSGKVLIGYGSPWPRTTFAKPNINLGLNISYRILNANSKEVLTISTEMQISLGRVYEAIYQYKYDDIEDNFIVSNRGYLYNLSLSIPLKVFK